LFFMTIVVALFLGLIISAEEIFRDRKILKREAFLNLSRSGYLVSKILILFAISAIQAILFILIGNAILGVKGMNFQYWLAYFSVAAFGNMLALNISASFNSNVTIYILIPLLLIPEMILGGAMFSFDKLNKKVSSVGRVPWIAEIMVTKWAYEALMVYQFKNNEFEKYFYDVEKIESIADYKQVYYLPELNKKLDKCIDDFNLNMVSEETEKELILLQNEFNKELSFNNEIEFNLINYLNVDSFTPSVGLSAKEYLQKLDKFYSRIFQLAYNKKEERISFLVSRNPGTYRQRRNDYHNESVEEIVKKIFEKNKIVEDDNELIQHVDPIYQDPQISSLLDIRSHFYAPRKHFAGKLYDTFNFNIVVIWILTILLYITLYYEHLKKLLAISEKFNKKK
ncbi:ABC transporter permease, partial [Bacteroidota bacterium]